ncbi:MAG: extracellular solute-binding protein [Anaerolineae bacterium]|nr:extracellular solute-binding protein [Anaerolineae bacterium]MDW8173726.1 extracellular solute-binding protein [Anaerolineae bacterium]
MKKLVFALAALSLLMSLPTLAQDDACDVPPPAQETRVNMIGWTFPIMDFYAAELAKCSEVPNLTVNVQLLASADAQSEMRLAASSQGASPYDIIHGSNAFIGEMASKGWLLPLNDLIDKYREQYDLDDIDASSYAAASQDGIIYGIPIVVNTQHFYYNTEILEAAGIEPPQTYTDVIAACQAMDEEALGIDFAFGMVLSAGWAWQIEWVNIYNAFGGALLDENNMPIFNDEVGVESLELLMGIVNACLGEDGLTLSTDNLQAGLANGSIAMGHMWASRAAMMDDEELSDVVGKIEFAPALFPTTEQTIRAGIAWGDFLAIPATSEVDKELLFQIIMEAADKESQMAATEFGLVPRKSAEVKAPRYSPAALQTIIEGGPATSNPAQAILNSALGQFLPKVATGELSAKEALDAAAQLYIEEATKQGFIK